MAESGNEQMVTMMFDALIGQLERDAQASVDSASHSLKANFPGMGDAIDAAADRVRRMREQIFEGNNASIGTEYGHLDRWYYGPQPQHENWKRFKQRLANSGKEFLIDGLDRESNGILSLCANPKRLGVRRMGLVVGNVQSGKTANYTSVIAKAADVGYRFFIVLAGVHNNLRKQTQSRLGQDLFSREWGTLTTNDEDFGGLTMAPDALITRSGITVAVIKKNAHRLQNLINWYSDSPESVRRNFPTLILDDEADQATPNTATKTGEFSGINSKIRELWGLVPTGTYLAYTATPFANVFMNPDDEEELFPDDFIVAIPAGDAYFGAEQIFGRATPNDDTDRLDGIDVVRDVPDDDVQALRPPTKKELRSGWQLETVPPSLRKAVRWFLLATATRRARGQQEHSSMLVHTTHFADPHFAVQAALQDDLESISMDDPTTVTELAQMWDEESPRAAGVSTGAAVAWDEVSAELPNVIAEAKVIVDNGSSDDRLNYDRKDAGGRRVPETVIAVGGGTLSRGLTLEGLVVSYFIRTSNTYDTLMQMGRWFGYRPGYEDLQRIWAPRSLVSEYQFLALVESDLRNEIDYLSRTGHSPQELGVRVRAHPGRLEITARNKMAHASDVQVTLSGQRRQTFIFDGHSRDVVKRNWTALDNLIDRVGRSPEAVPWAPSNGRGLLTDIDRALVIRFLQEYRFHDDQALFDAELMADWINNHTGPDATWSLVIMGNSKDRAGLGQVDVAGRSYNLIARSAMKDSIPEKINIKALMSSADRLADIDPRFYAGRATSSEADVRRVRQEVGGSGGLLLAYPISKDSPPSSETRIGPPTDFDLLGVGVVFPEASGVREREGDFVSVRRTWDVDVVHEEDEVVDTEGSTSELEEADGV